MKGALSPTFPLTRKCWEPGPYPLAMDTQDFPTDANTRDTDQRGFDIDLNLWDDILSYVAFAQGRNLSARLKRYGVTKSKWGIRELIAHVVFVQWNKSAMLCKKTRDDIILNFGGISPMLKKPCVGFGCAVCHKYQECKAGLYEGELDPFPQVIASGNYQPLSAEELDKQLMFAHQRHERPDDWDEKHLT